LAFTPMRASSLTFLGRTSLPLPSIETVSVMRVRIPIPLFKISGKLYRSVPLGGLRWAGRAALLVLKPPQAQEKAAHTQTLGTSAIAMSSYNGTNPDASGGSAPACRNSCCNNGSTGKDGLFLSRTGDGQRKPC
jgi:hypothetical protein